MIALGRQKLIGKRRFFYPKGAGKLYKDQNDTWKPQVYITSTIPQTKTEIQTRMNKMTSVQTRLELMIW